MRLQVVMLDRSDALEAVLHLGEAAPFRRRLVTIELTAEQQAQLRPRPVRQVSKDTDQLECVGDVWLDFTDESEAP